MRKPGGYALWSGGPLPDIEMDTFTCAHCNSVVFVKPFEDPTSVGGWCIKCADHLCWRCAGTGVCAPWEKQMEAMEAADRVRREIICGGDDLKAKIEANLTREQMLRAVLGG